MRINTGEVAVPAGLEDGAALVDVVGREVRAEDAVGREVRVDEAALADVAGREDEAALEVGFCKKGRGGKDGKIDCGFLA